MRGTGAGNRFWGALLLLLAGCWATEQQQLKPPPHPEEAVVPPESDPRFSAPVAYPKEAERDQSLKKPSKDPTDPMGAPNRFGASGMGGRGY